MSTRNAEYIEAVEHLPAGAMLVLHGVSWEEYENLLEDLTSHPGFRVTYDGGKLEIMSPLPEHEAYKEFISDLARAFADMADLPLEKFGSTTWKRRRLQKGTEPDCCFYVTSAHRIVGKRTIDLESDPPPDIVVEVDTTNASRHKFSIYAALGVPEIWRYDGSELEMYSLSGAAYARIHGSRFLQDLTCSILTEFLEISKTQGQTSTLQLFRQRLQS